MMVERLTATERAAALLVAEGARNRDIAVALHVSEMTAKNVLNGHLSPAGSAAPAEPPHAAYPADAGGAIPRKPAFWLGKSAMLGYNLRNVITVPGRWWNTPRRDQHLQRRCGMGTVRLPLGADNFAVIDEEDYPLVSRYHWRTIRSTRRLYAIAYVYPFGNMLLHRWLLNPPAGIHVDHRDNDSLNCTRANMRLATPSQNQRNQPKSKVNTSGYKGVCWDKNRQLWMAKIRDNGKTRTLGHFSNREEAARAYDERAREIAGAFARLNFPREGELQA